MTARGPCFADRDLKLGTSTCPVCGFFFPLTTDPTKHTATCYHCGTTCYPKPSSAFFSIDLEPIKTTVEEEEATVKTDKDQRTTEDTYCEKCKKVTACYVYAQQTRGADEGQTIFYQCSECKAEWLLNS